MISSYSTTHTTVVIHIPKSVLPLAWCNLTHTHSAPIESITLLLHIVSTLIPAMISQCLHLPLSAMLHLLAPYDNYATTSGGKALLLHHTQIDISGKCHHPVVKHIHIQTFTFTFTHSHLHRILCGASAARSTDAGSAAGSSTDGSAQVALTGQRR